MEVLHIREGTINVDKHQYAYHKHLKIVYFSESVKSIGDSAFEECNSLTTLHLNEGLESIGNSAFEGCNSLTTLHLNEGLESIGNYAFARCFKIKSLCLPNSLRSINQGTFQSCKSLTSLYIPSNVQVINAFAFQGCFGIKTLYLPETLYIGERAFYACISINSLVFPLFLTTKNDKDPFDVLKNSFASCNNLERVLAPDILTNGEIADPNNVFSNCPILVGAGLTPYSTVPLLRRTFWHPTMDLWCTRRQRECVLAVLVAELRLDLQSKDIAVLPSLEHDWWLLILQFVPRYELGHP